MKLSPELVARLTVVNTILLGCILVLLLFNMTTVQPEQQSGGVGTTSQVGSHAGSPSGSPPGGSFGGGAPPSDIKKIIDDTLFPLERAIIDHEGNPNEVLPSGEEIDAAVLTGNLGSAEAQLVIEKLKKGYALYKMPFPNLAPPPSSERSPQQQSDEQKKTIAGVDSSNC